MPAQRGTDTSGFDERLGVPWHWWLVAAGIVTVGGAEIAVGLRWQLVVAVYVAVVAAAGAALVGMGRTRIRVDARGVHAGDRTLPPDDVVTAQALAPDQTRLMLGPAADPAAHVVARGWIRTAVLVRTRPGHPQPYWLLSTRRPADAAAAVLRLVGVSGGSTSVKR